ncbi:hypothetical protein OE88DRAFT_1728932 [Heliocybe sulcata]|uniref:Uncharacterized protein n=1 Tax=Heliocybe sulcata TaxID=5364 RepID=A0A5C3MQG6_9AGAM|nr:hypothetical protein OE88DRAFT_1728932 [Heliocybe sulcata]
MDPSLGIAGPVQEGLEKGSEYDGETPRSQYVHPAGILSHRTVRNVLLFKDRKYTSVLRKVEFLCFIRVPGVKATIEIECALRTRSRGRVGSGDVESVVGPVYDERPSYQLLLHSSNVFADLKEVDGAEDVGIFAGKLSRAWVGNQTRKHARTQGIALHGSTLGTGSPVTTCKQSPLPGVAVTLTRPSFEHDTQIRHSQRHATGVPERRSRAKCSIAVRWSSVRAECGREEAPPEKSGDDGIGDESSSLEEGVVRNQSARKRRSQGAEMTEQAASTVGRYMDEIRPALRADFGGAYIPDQDD